MEHFIFNLIKTLLSFNKDNALKLYNNFIIKRLSKTTKNFTRNIINIQYHNIYNINFLNTNHKYIIHFTNYKLVIDHIYDKKNYELLLKNKEVLNYISENYIMFSNLIDYLYLKKKYNIIYLYENFNEYIKEKYKTIIKSLFDVDIEDKDELNKYKKDINEKFKPYIIEWIN
jgi:hypothetical protein